MATLEVTTDELETISAALRGSGMDLVERALELFDLAETAEEKAFFPSTLAKTIASIKNDIWDYLTLHQPVVNDAILKARDDKLVEANTASSSVNKKKAIKEAEWLYTQEKVLQAYDAKALKHKPKEP